MYVGADSGTIYGDFCEILCVGSTVFTTLTDAYARTSAEYGTKATGTLTITSNVPHAESSLEIGATTYTWKTTPTTAHHFQIGATDDAAGVATSIADVVTKVNAHSTDVTAAVTNTGVVTFTAVSGGTAGNSLALVLGGTTTHQAVSGAVLAGGTDVYPATGTYATGVVLRGKFTAVDVSSGMARCTVASPLP